jgi:smad nuclear-interacting protein 1
MTSGPSKRIKDTSAQLKSAHPNMSNSTSSQGQRNSRWGAAVSSSLADPPSKAAAAVDDVSAAKALLAEAAAHEQTKLPVDNRKHRHDNEGDRSRNSTRPKRPRREGGTKEDQLGNYYGPSPADGSTANNGNGDAAAPVEKVKPDFGLSGALAADSGKGGGGGNMYKGVLLKFQEPPEARTPTTKWRLYVFKGEEQIETLHIAKQSAYLLGRNEDIADILLSHPSCSSQHAVLQYRAVPRKETGKVSCLPYLLDLESTNGSFINGVRIDPARYYQLKKQDVLKFGASTREYVLLAA